MMHNARSATGFRNITMFSTVTQTNDKMNILLGTHGLNTVLNFGQK